MLTLATVACSAPSTDSDGRLHVVASTSVVADIVANVVGDDAVVDVLLPLGADPHEMQLSARQAAQVRAADLVVVVGLGLEAGMADSLGAARTDGARVLELGSVVEPRTFTDGGRDPHFWLDPTQISLAAFAIAAELTEMDDQAGWSDRATAYAERLALADGLIHEQVATVPSDRRTIVTNHDSFGYFADRYGFTIIGVVIPGGSTVASPSSADLAALVNIIDEEKVSAIFVENTESDRLAIALKTDANVDVAIVDVLGASLAEPGQPGDNLIDLLLENARRITAAIGGAGS